MSRSVFRSLAAISLLALAGSATAVPIGGGTTAIYVGSADFVSNGSVGVSGASYASCSNQLTQAINYRTSTWGWVVSTIHTCHNSRWLGPPFRPYAFVEGTHVSDPQWRAALRADADLRTRYNIDAYEAEQAKIFEQPAEIDGGTR